MIMIAEASHCLQLNMYTWERDVAICYPVDPPTHALQADVKRWVQKGRAQEQAAPIMSLEEPLWPAMHPEH